jgi:phosphatidate cytidylyltransferase
VAERDDRDERPPKRRPAEGVRIIRPEEAQAALDAGQAAGRRPDDEPRFGDVPAAPSGPRPPHRFPLPDSVDPAAAVPRPPVRAGEPAGSRPGSAAGAIPRSSASVEPPASAEPDHPRAAEPEPDLSVPREGISFQSGTGPELPHWTDPPTGEIPRIGPDQGTGPKDDDLAAWQALGSRGLRWRDGGTDWDEVDDVGNLRGDEPRLGALDTSRTEHSDLYSFDAQFERLEEERSGQHPLVEPEPPAAAPTRAVPQAGGPLAGRGGPARRSGTRPPRPPAAGGRDMTSAVVVGVVLIVVLGGAYLVGPAAMLVLATVVVLASALELYNIIQRSGFRPATLLGLCATVAVMFAAYWRGEQALPLVLVLVFMTSMLWYMFDVVDARPMINVAVTVMAFVWVGLLGSYASLLLKVTHGKGLLLGAVLVTVAADISAYFAGSQFGSRPLAPGVSPGKTLEGALVGAVGAVVVGAVVGLKLHPWGGSFAHGVELGVVVAIVAPIGDLCESMIKRDLHLKDSGALLPGHGGLLDRFDSLLFVLPATYYLAQYLRLH